MAKTTAKKAAKTKKPVAARGARIFKGNLPKIRGVIESVQREMAAGRKTATEQIARFKHAVPGTLEGDKLAANKAALEQAERLLAGLEQANTTLSGLCCHSDQSCNFLVHMATRKK